MDGCIVHRRSDARRDLLYRLPDPDRQLVDALLVPRAIFTSASNGKCDYDIIQIYGRDIHMENPFIHFVVCTYFLLDFRVNLNLSLPLAHCNTNY